MVNFSEYFESMVKLKPEWRKAFIDYPRLNKLLAEVKKHVHIEVHLKDGTVQAVKGVKQFQELVATGTVSHVGDGEHMGGEGKFVILLDEQTDKDRDAAAQAHKTSKIHIQIPGAFGSSPQDDDDLTGLFSRNETSDPFGHHSVSTRNGSCENQPLLDNEQLRDVMGEGSAPTRSSGTTLRALRMPSPPGSSTPVLAGERQTPDMGTFSPVLPKVSMEGFLPPEAQPEKARGGGDASPKGAARTDSRTSQVHGYVPKITNVGVTAAAEFEALLKSEVEKAVLFARQSLNTFYNYFDTNKKQWANTKNFSRPRAKESMRYLYAEVTHLRDFVDTNELAVKKALKKYLHAHPFFIRDEISEQTLIPLLHDAANEAAKLREALCATWAEIFEEDVTNVKQTILAQSGNPSQAFRAGFLLAMVVATILYWVHVFFELGLNDDAMTRFTRIFPVARLLILLSFAYTTWSFTLFNFEKFRINYLYLLELSQKASMTWMQCLEHGLLMFWLTVLCTVLYARSIHERAGRDCYASSDGFPGASPYFLPVCIGLFVITIAVPVRHVFHRSRSAFFRSLWRCIKQPFGGAPKFQDFLVADIGTSFSCFAQDLVYAVCYYTATPPEKNHLHDPAWDTCTDVRKHYGLLLAMLPYFWRACHTFKMYRKTGQKAHVVNHGKYLTLLTYMLLDLWYNNEPNETLHVFVWILHVAAQVYSYTWDITMDWGWIRGKERGTMMKSMTPHYAAIVFDLLARAFFIPGTLYFKGRMGDTVFTTFSAMLEIIRRSVWCVFRLENENLNNLEKYRTVDFVPHAVLHDD